MKEFSATRLTAAAFKAPTRSIERIRWPGGMREVGVLTLTCAELQQAYFAARLHFERQRQTLDAFSVQHLSFEMDYQLCARMLVDPDGLDETAKVFRDADEVRRVLEPDEVAYFCELHQELQRKRVDSWGDRPALDPHLRRIALVAGCAPDATPAQIVQAVERLAAQDSNVENPAIQTPAGAP